MSGIKIIGLRRKAVAMLCLSTNSCLYSLSCNSTMERTLRICRSYAEFCKRTRFPLVRGCSAASGTPESFPRLTMVPSGTRVEDSDIRISLLSDSLD